MKKLFYQLLLFFFPFICFAQTDKNVGIYFEFTENIALNRCDAVGNSIAGSEIIMRGIQYRIDAVANGNYVIHILKKGSDVAFNQRFFKSTYSTADTDNSPDTYFQLPITSFNTKSKPRLTKNSFTIGLVNLPVKIRFGSPEKEEGAYKRNFLLANDISLGLSLGYKRKWNEDWGINVLGGVSLSSIQVDSSTTKGYAKSASNISSLTGHIGFLIENNNFQFGVFTGIDFLTGEVGRNWAYKNKPWLGVAIGFSLFKTKSSSDSQ